MALVSELFWTEWVIYINIYILHKCSSKVFVLRYCTSHLCQCAPPQPNSLVSVMDFRRSRGRGGGGGERRRDEWVRNNKEEQRSTRSRNKREQTEERKERCGSGERRRSPLWSELLYYSSVGPNNAVLIVLLAKQAASICLLLEAVSIRSLGRWRGGKKEEKKSLLLLRCFLTGRRFAFVTEWGRCSPQLIWSARTDSQRFSSRFWPRTSQQSQRCCGT